MPTVQLKEILQRTGTTSLRGLMQHTGSSENSALRQGQIASIDLLYRDNAKALGFPLKEVEFDGNNEGQRDYSGGTIHFLDHSPKHTHGTYVTVRYLGFKCISESDWDQSSAADEPYFMIGVAGSSNSNTIRFGPYEDVDDGESRYEAAFLANAEHMIVPPAVLACAVKENDFGTPEEAEAKVRKAIEDMEAKLESAVGAFSGVSMDDHVMPEWARDIYIGYLPEWIAAGFGMGDDDVGRTPVVLFDNKVELEQWAIPPVKGKHGPNDYNVVVNVDGGSQGNYDLYFLVGLVDIDMTQH